jgi:DNA polymerase III gamma/tau subunit
MQRVAGAPNKPKKGKKQMKNTTVAKIATMLFVATLSIACEEAQTPAATDPAVPETVQAVELTETATAPPAADEVAAPTEQPVAAPEVAPAPVVDPAAANTGN